MSESALSSNDMAFPRGGSTALSALEVKEISNEATRDVLFESGETKKRSHSDKAKKARKKTRRAPNKEDEVVEENSVSIENFNFKTLVPGSLVLGRISKIGKLDLTLSLGDNLEGYVPITSISSGFTRSLEDFENDAEDVSESKYNESNEENTITSLSKEKEVPSLDSHFVIGQWLQAKVVSNTDERKHKRLLLTIEPELLNSSIEAADIVSGNTLQCVVESIEDHGIVLATGLSQFNGFISFSEIKNAGLFKVDDIKPNSVILTFIKSSSNRTLNLVPFSEESMSKKVSVSTIASVDSVMPGIVVNSLVSQVTKNGLVVKVFGLIDGIINLANLGDYNYSSLKHKFAIGSTINTRVMGVIRKAGVLKLLLTVLPILLQPRSLDNREFNALEAFPIGYIFDSVEIKGSDPNYLFVDTGSSIDAQVHNSRIDPAKSIGIDYSIGSKHKARVIGFNSIENILVLSFSPEVIHAKYLSSRDIPIGEYISDGTIQSFNTETGSLKVKIFDNFEALVPRNHISDVKLIYPERKFKVGSKFKGRVLSKQGNRIYVTIKKTLVNLEGSEILSTFEQAKIGSNTLATVEKFVHNGAIVSFFGNLKAYLPKNEISETFVNHASDYIRVGQTLRTKVLNVNQEERRIIVTLRQSQDSLLSKDTMASIQPGVSILKVRTVEKNKESIIVQVENNNLRGVLYVGHLSDMKFEQNRALLKKLPIGEELEVLVLEKDLNSRSLIVTAKESLIAGAKAGKVPAYFKDIKVDDTELRGFVKSVTNMGLFVSFAGKLTGLVLAKYATENNHDDLSKLFFKYQAISCKVIRIDNQNRRFLLSLSKLQRNSENLKGDPLINPVDTTKVNVSDYFPGVTSTAVVRSVKGTQLNMQLADNLQGRLDSTSCFNNFDEIKNKRQPLSQFSKGDKLKVKVIGYHDVRTHKFLPVTHKKSNSTMLELSILDRDMNSLNQDNHQNLIVDYSEGQEVLCYVNNIAKNFVWVTVSNNVNGKISFMDLDDDTSLFNDIENNFPIGAALKAKVKAIDTEHGILVLSRKENRIQSVSDLNVGDSFASRIVKLKETYVLVNLGNDIIASSYITDALDDYSQSLDAVFTYGDFATATVLNIDEDKKTVAVSLRTKSALDPEINSISDLSRGQVLRGFIKNIGNNGIYVSLGRSIHALVRVTDLSDSYLKNWKNYFKVNQMVKGKIISCHEEGRILMSLKETEVNGNVERVKNFPDLNINDIFEGSVKNVTEFGVFVRLDGTNNISGLCHHSEIADTDIKDPKALFGEGDRVKVKILDINLEKKQLSLGMKASYFSTENSPNPMVSSDDEMNDEDNGDMQESNDDMQEDIVMDEVSSEADSELSDDEEVETIELAHKSSEGLSTNGFDWTASILDQVGDDESSSDDEDFLSQKQKKKTTNRVIDRTADMNTRVPQSVSDFERLLISNSNSSILWMNYMSFQLQLGEVDKAREIANRALDTINYREESEKLNIWIALLNLENSFGSQESLEEVFKKSCQYMDAFTMHQKLISIYTMSDKYDDADKLFKKTAKKFSQNVSIWVQYGSFLLDRSLHKRVHETLAKALQILPSRDHVEVVRKFAQLEFTKGDPEQGRSLFEGLIADSPRRIDLWNVYIDQEIKHGDSKNTEALFERVIQVKLSKRQAKFFFKKWLDFAEERKDEKSIARIKAKAAEYVRTMSKE